MSDARRVLERLLRKGERTRLRGDAAPASLPMTEAGAPVLPHDGDPTC